MFLDAILILGEEVKRAMGKNRFSVYLEAVCNENSAVKTFLCPPIELSAKTLNKKADY